MARKRKWTRAGRYEVEGTVSYTVDKSGRYRDKNTGRLISAYNAKRRKPGRVTAVIERTLKDHVYQGRVVSTDWTYRAKIPKGVAPKDKKKFVDALAKAMNDRGIRTLPKKKGMAQVKFYVYVEGEARDLRTKRKGRGVTGIAHRRNLAAVKMEAKDKITSLIEGGTLGTSLVTGSGVKTMKAGPDTVYMVASYGIETPVPGLDFIPKKARKKT
jgi:hypothetical protein